MEASWIMEWRQLLSPQDLLADDSGHAHLREVLALEGSLAAAVGAESPGDLSE